MLISPSRSLPFDEMGLDVWISMGGSGSMSRYISARKSVSFHGFMSSISLHCTLLPICCAATIRWHLRLPEVRARGAWSASGARGDPQAAAQAGWLVVEAMTMLSFLAEVALCLALACLCANNARQTIRPSIHVHSIIDTCYECCSILCYFLSPEIIYQHYFISIDSSLVRRQHIMYYGTSSQDHLPACPSPRSSLDLAGISLTTSANMPSFSLPIATQPIYTHFKHLSTSPTASMKIYTISYWIFPVFTRSSRAHNQLLARPISFPPPAG